MAEPVASALIERQEVVFVRSAIPRTDRDSSGCRDVLTGSDSQRPTGRPAIRPGRKSCGSRLRRSPRNRGRGPCCRLSSRRRGRPPLRGSTTRPNRRVRPARASDRADAAGPSVHCAGSSPKRAARRWSVPRNISRISASRLITPFAAGRANQPQSSPRSNSAASPSIPPTRKEIASSGNRSAATRLHHSTKKTLNTAGAS